MKKYTPLALRVIVILLIVYQLASAVVFAHITGILVVHASPASAKLAVTRMNYLEKNIGTGDARVRLKPGRYNVSMTTDGKNISETVKIVRGQTTEVSLTPNTQAAQGPSDTIQAKTNELVALLPFTGPNFQYEVTGSFTRTAQPQFVITITSPTSQGKQQAQAWLENLGFNLSDFNIQYVDSPTDTNSGQPAASVPLDPPE